MIYEKNAKGLPPLRRSTLSKKHKIGRLKFKKNYTNLISVGMIGNYNYIATNLNGSIQEVEPKGINPFQFLQFFTKITMIERHIGLVIKN